jgi:hypothetical protein
MKSVSSDSFTANDAPFTSPQRPEQTSLNIQAFIGSPVLVITFWFFIRYNFVLSSLSKSAGSTT